MGLDVLEVLGPEGEAFLQGVGMGVVGEVD